MQVIGGGKMGEALLAGILSSGWCEASAVRVVELSESRRDELVAGYPGLKASADVDSAEGTILAVKPADAPTMAAAAGATGGSLLSIAAGVTLAQLESAAGAEVPIVRAMPNTPALVGVGAAAIAPGRWADSATMDWAEELLGSVGLVVRVAESALDAVTGLSGSGPAYVFLVVEALIDAGVLCGLTRDVAESLAVQTLLGSATLLAQSSESAAQLRAAVTSPGGTTAAGLRVLEQHGVRAALIDAVVAARDRAVDMGGDRGGEMGRSS